MDKLIKYFKMISRNEDEYHMLLLAQYFKILDNIEESEKKEYELYNPTYISFLYLDLSKIKRELEKLRSDNIDIINKK